ncbi:hypothetical protein M493_15870 [Geobacillus genomosp. 3]|uniref:Uncharacterized protein n=1 Tax=Geobacillus genomosp. 3 TaxID=1921421 RepID=S5ZGE0_GEOG3|nr:hypothetical protein M493_15870 [Geobacillus genomosp. 3]
MITVRFATTGTNWITESFIDAARLVDSFEFAAVYSRAEETAHAAASTDT